MNDKIKPTHLERSAYVYVRQSTAAQVQYNRESTDRQYKLTERALRLGWPEPQIKVVDEDLARSGSGTSDRHGFALMTTEVALGHVGLILSIEVSRVARNNADWYRLLDLCGVTDTLIGDEDGIYHPGLFNDRLLLGLKGTMAEAELHVIRARLEGGIRNKAARGELRRGLPVGFVWGDEDGEVSSILTRRSPMPLLGLREVRRIRLDPPGMALAPFGGSLLSLAVSFLRNPMGHSYLYRHSPYLDQSGLCRRLYLW